jgi:AbrB family looped-hinge helix DNA binding protein
MTAITKVQRNFQITIPSTMRKKLKLQVGDLIGVELREEGLLVKPLAAIDRNQAWFWARGWQEEEKKVEEDLRKGRVKTSKNVEGFIRELEE